MFESAIRINLSTGVDFDHIFFILTGKATVYILTLAVTIIKPYVHFVYYTQIAQYIRSGFGRLWSIRTRYHVHCTRCCSSRYIKKKYTHRYITCWDNRICVSAAPAAAVNINTSSNNYIRTALRFSNNNNNIPLSLSIIIYNNTNSFSPRICSIYIIYAQYYLEGVIGGGSGRG